MRLCTGNVIFYCYSPTVFLVVDDEMSSFNNTFIFCHFNISGLISGHVQNFRGNINANSSEFTVNLLFCGHEADALNKQLFVNTFEVPILCPVFRHFNDLAE